MAERGQATVEAIAALPALILAGLLSLQLLAAGYALTLADGAAESGALALAAGRPAVAAARGALPGWAHERVRVSISGGEVLGQAEAAVAPLGAGGSPHRQLQRPGTAAARMSAGPIACTRLGPAPGSLELAAALAVHGGLRTRLAAGRGAADRARRSGTVQALRFSPRPRLARSSRRWPESAPRAAARGRICHLRLRPDPEGVAACRRRGRRGPGPASMHRARPSGLVPVSARAPRPAPAGGAAAGRSRRGPIARRTPGRGPERRRDQGEGGQASAGLARRPAGAGRAATA